jgi:hypothetical protein
MKKLLVIFVLAAAISGGIALASPAVAYAGCPSTAHEPYPSSGIIGGWGEVNCDALTQVYLLVCLQIWESSIGWYDDTCVWDDRNSWGYSLVATRSCGFYAYYRTRTYASWTGGASSDVCCQVWIQC